MIYKQPANISPQHFISFYINNSNNNQPFLFLSIIKDFHDQVYALFGGEKFKSPLHTELFGSIPNKTSETMPPIEFNIDKTLKLADILRELGPTTSINTHSLVQIFEEFSDLKEADILDIFLMAVNNLTDEPKSDPGLVNATFQTVKNYNWNSLKVDQDPKTQHSWNVESIIKACNQILPGLDWTKVVLSLDRPNPVLNGSQSVKYLFQNFAKFKRAPTF